MFSLILKASLLNAAIPSNINNFIESLSGKENWGTNVSSHSYRTAISGKKESHIIFNAKIYIQVAMESSLVRPSSTIIFMTFLR